MIREVILTQDGSKTLYLPELNEQYHSLNGAVTESDFVFIDKGYKFHQKNDPVVFEVGFGTGLNCLLTAILAENEKRPTCYLSIEKYPLKTELIDELNYGNLISAEASTIFKCIHSCEWNVSVNISPFFTLTKINDDLISTELAQLKEFDIVYFDAFGPDKQPEMWSPEVFHKIFSHCSDNAVFVTYSAKGEVRRRLSAAGFQMERLSGPPGKKEMLRGIKNSSKN